MYQIFELPSVITGKKCNKFIGKYHASDNALCRLCVNGVNLIIKCWVLSSWVYVFLCNRTYVW